MLESIAQASAVLVSLIIDAKASRKNVYLFAGVDKARFRSPAEPGDQLVIDVSLGAHRKRCGGAPVKSRSKGGPSAPQRYCLPIGRLSD